MLNNHSDQFKDVLYFRSTQHMDYRGFFQEVYKTSDLLSKGVPSFAQENMSFSKAGVFRGMHFQYPCWQGKLVRVIGKVVDFWMDLRLDNGTYGNFGRALLHTGEMLYIPEGFAHGFLALEDSYFIYSCTQVYEPNNEYCLGYQYIPQVVESMKLMSNINMIEISDKDSRGLDHSEIRGILKGLG